MPRSAKRSPKARRTSNSRRSSKARRHSSRKRSGKRRRFGSLDSGEKELIELAQKIKAYPETAKERVIELHSSEEQDDREFANFIIQVLTECEERGKDGRRKCKTPMGNYDVTVVPEGTVEGTLVVPMVMGNEAGGPLPSGKGKHMVQKPSQGSKWEGSNKLPDPVRLPAPFYASGVPGDPFPPGFLPETEKKSKLPARQLV